MKKLVLVFILLAVGGGGAYYYYAYGKAPEKPQVIQATISQGPIREAVQATGTLEALRTVAIGSQVSGTVKDIYADFNSIVKAGQLLAELDPQLLQVQVDLQNANVERQKGEIANQEVQLEDSKKQLERTQQMAEKGLANQQTLEQSILTVKTRTTAVDSAKKQLLTNQANLDQAKLNVSYTKIYAPIDGVVVDRRVDRGQTVQASMTTPQFFTIATDLRQLKLTAGVDEAEIGKVRKGMAVQFTVESYPGTFSGEVDQVRLNATSQSNVVTYPVWINAPNPDFRLRPSMTATVQIIISTEPSVIRIPNQALRFRPTSDMYTALGLTPPAVGQGRGTVARGDGAAGAADAAAPGAAAGTPGAGGARRQRNGGDTAAVDGAPGAPGAPAVAAGGPQGAQGRGQAAAGDGQGQRQRNPNGQGGGQGTGGGRGQDGAAGAGGQNRGGGAGGRGFGGGQFANMTPEERQRMQAQFAGGRGGAGGGRGGAGGAGGGRGGRNSAINTAVPSTALSADKIDDLFAPMERRATVGTVWTWDEAKKEMKSTRITTGINDGQFSQLVSGDVKVGQQVLTSIVLPITAAQRQQQSIFGQQPNRGGGGLQPGGPGGGGAPGGGAGGGGRGGGGGGGRGGN